MDPEVPGAADSAGRLTGEFSASRARALTIEWALSTSLRFGIRPTQGGIQRHSKEISLVDKGSLSNLDSWLRFPR